MDEIIIPEDFQVEDSEKIALERRVACLENGVRSECEEDVIAIAENLFSEDKSFSEAVRETVEKYPIFGKIGEKKGIVKVPVTPISGNPAGIGDIIRNEQVRRK